MHAVALELRQTLERVAIERADSDPDWWRQSPTAKMVRSALRRAKLAGIEPQDKSS